MSKFISQTYHHQQQHNYHQYMKIISCNLSSYIHNNHLTYITKSINILLSSRRRIVVNQVQVNKNNTISNYKHYHNKDQQQYRLYQSTRCILQSASSSSSTTTTPDNSSGNNNKNSSSSSLPSNPSILRSKETLKDSDILPFPFDEDTVEKKVRPNLGIITSKSWSCTKLRKMNEIIPDELPPPDAKWVKITKELLESTTPTVDKVANDFLSLDILELNQLFRLLQVRSDYI